MSGNRVRIRQRFAGLSKFLTAVALLAVVAAAAIMLTSRDDTNYVTVDFKQTNSLYEGSDVKILGVPVGRIESMSPKGNVVRVKIAYDGKYKLPRNVKAAIVSPSVVGDRFVQLAPVYDGGAVLPNNANLNIKHSAVPLELDKIYSSLDDFAQALGPTGANKNGSLSRFVDSTAKQYDGQGEQLNETIKNFSKLSQTLSNNKDELFGSLDEVQTFVAMLKKNDSSVRRFNSSTAKVSTVLEGERDDLAATLKALGLALNDVHTLVKENRTALRGDVDDLASVSQVLADNKKSLEETITAAPTALSNVGFTYNEKYGTLDTRANLVELLTGGDQDPKKALCALLGNPSGGTCASVAAMLAKLPVPKVPANKPPADKLPVTLPRTAVASGAGPNGEQVNDSLRDMLAVN